MQFIDEAKVFLQSGKGGNGCASFRREANIPFGGPDGGDGGRGGDIIFRAVSNLNTLIDFRYKQHFKAKSGEPGRGRNQHGKSGENLIIDVPVGTQIFSEDGDMLIADLLNEGDQITLLGGGRGGMGNTTYKTSTNRAPRKTTSGVEGEEMYVWLKLKIISDVGLVGLPNAGKSTFLSVVSRAKPKIADYPFTTLKPMLGVVTIGLEEFVVADIPGLIKGAHLGVGLGHRFLKHIERCKIILHLIDITSNDIIKDYKVIRKELESYSEILLEKQEIIAFTKTELLSDDEVKEKIKSLKASIKRSRKKIVKDNIFEEEDITIFEISSLTNKNIEEIKKKILTIIKNQ